MGQEILERAMQADIATLERRLVLARQVILLLASELPPARLTEPRLTAALELSLTNYDPLDAAGGGTAGNAR